MKSKKHNPDALGFAYSTDPNFQFTQGDDDATTTLEPGKQRLYVSLSTKHRAGKAVTLVEGFVGANEDREALGKQLKSHCGTGGSVKDGDIIVQGDNKEKVFAYLQAKGYKLTKRK
jgi:translation initiation factor 1